MPYTVAVERSFRAHLALPSPARAAAAVPPHTGGIDVVLTVGIEFAEDQLTDRGWFLDTDAIDDLVTERANFLASAAWTDLFEFRPTYELVTRELFHHLAGSITQLRYVQLTDRTFGVTTRFSP